MSLDTAGGLAVHNRMMLNIIWVLCLGLDIKYGCEEEKFISQISPAYWLLAALFGSKKKY